MKLSKKLHFVAATVFIVSVLVLFGTAKRYRVAASSMMPTLVKGDKVIVNLVAYDLKIPFTDCRILRWSDPKPGDIVLFSVPNRERGYIGFKRVVAVPGDMIELRDHKLSVNGRRAIYEQLDDRSLRQLPPDAYAQRHFEKEIIGEQSRAIMLTSASEMQSAFGPVAVPSDQYFLLGDNRDNSNDSRIFGPVTRTRILGRLLFRVP